MATDCEGGESQHHRNASRYVYICHTKTKIRTAFHRPAPHRTAPHRTAPHRTAPHRTAPQRSALHRTAQHRTVQQYRNITTLKIRTAPPWDSSAKKRKKKTNAQRRLGWFHGVKTLYKIAPLLLLTQAAVKVTHFIFLFSEASHLTPLQLETLFFL